MKFSRLIISSIFLMFFSSFSIQSEAVIDQISALNQVTIPAHSFRSKLAYTRYAFNIFETLLINFFNMIIGSFKKFSISWIYGAGTPCWECEGGWCCWLNFFCCLEENGHDKNVVTTLRPSMMKKNKIF